MNPYLSESESHNSPLQKSLSSAFDLVGETKNAVFEAEIDFINGLISRTSYLETGD